MFKKPKKDKTEESKKPPSAPKVVSEDHKKSIFIGLVLIIMAFGCVVGIFYFLVSAQQTAVQETETLRAQLADMDAKQDSAEQKISELEGMAGRSIELDKLLGKADKLYGPEEKSRREGHLWIDRKADVFIVTLGAINGIEPGRQLTVYDGEKKVGMVRVEKPLDVISYVTPVEQKPNEFSGDYYRVVFEP